MATVRIKGILTPEGEIKVDLPENWLPGEVEILIPIELSNLTDEELLELMKPEPKPANEIETGGWEDLDIGDSVAFVEEMRRKHREGSQW